MAAGVTSFLQITVFGYQQLSSNHVMERMKRIVSWCKMHDTERLTLFDKSEWLTGSNLKFSTALECCTTSTSFDFSWKQCAFYARISHLLLLHLGEYIFQLFQFKLLAAYRSQSGAFQVVDKPFLNTMQEQKIFVFDSWEPYHFAFFKQKFECGSLQNIQISCSINKYF